MVYYITRSDNYCAHQLDSCYGFATIANISFKMQQIFGHFRVNWSWTKAKLFLTIFRQITRACCAAENWSQNNKIFFDQLQFILRNLLFTNCRSDCKSKIVLDANRVFHLYLLALIARDKFNLIIRQTDRQRHKIVYH